MRKASYITLGITGGLFVLFSLIWLVGLVVGQTFGGLVHLLLIAAIFAAFGVFVGLILLIISLAKK